MGPRQRVLAPWAGLLLALQLAGASHAIHQSLETVAAPPS
jgi:beta-fructofuranosidase